MSNRRAVITLFLLFSFTPAQAQNCIDYTDFLHVIDSVPLFESLYIPSRAIDVVAHGEYLYFAMEESGIITAKITADDKVHILGSLPTWNMAKALFTMNDQLFVADNSAGLQIFDISDAASPQWLAHIDTPGLALDVEAIDQRTFILDNYLGLVVIDNHEVRSPRIVASLSLPGNPRSMIRNGDLILITCQDEGLVIADISNPDQPTLLHILDISSQAQDVALQGDLLAVSNEDGLIQFYTMVTPRIFEPRGSIQAQVSYHRKLSFHNGLLLCNGFGHGLGVINVEDPDSPFVQGRQYSSLGLISAYTVVADRLVAANRMVDLVDFSQPELPPLLGSVPVSGRIRNVALYGDFAYVSNEDDGLRVVDMRDLSSPTVTTIYSDLVAGDIGVRGDYLYVTGVTHEVDVYSLNDPAFPTHVSSVSGDAAEHLSFHENLMILSGYDRLHIYDLSIPHAPEHLAFRIIDGLSQATIQGQYLYAVTGREAGLLVWDISNLSNPHQVSSYTNEYFVPEGVVAQGDYLYVSNDVNRRGFVVLDISDPMNISEVTSLPFGRSRVPGVIKDEVIYWCNDGGPIQLVDLHDPANPQQFSIIGNQRGYNDFDVQNEKIIALGYNYGLDAALLQCSALSSTETTELPLVHNKLIVFPNPFNPQTTIRWYNDSPSSLKITVYDLAGRKVAVLADRIFQSGPCSVQWDGRNDRGTSLPSGVFLISLKGNNLNTSRRISLVR